MQILPCTSLEARGAKGWLSSFSISDNDVLDFLFFIRKNATIAPTIKMDITIPAMPPPPIPDLLLPPTASDGLLLPLDLWFGLGLLAGGVPGGGGGAAPEFHELPSLLSWRLFQLNSKNLLFKWSIVMIIDDTIRCLLQINAFQLFRNPAIELITFNIPMKDKHR